MLFRCSFQGGVDQSDSECLKEASGIGWNGFQGRRSYREKKEKESGEMNFTAGPNSSNVQFLCSTVSVISVTATSYFILLWQP